MAPFACNTFKCWLARTTSSTYYRRGAAARRECRNKRCNQALRVGRTDQDAAHWNHRFRKPLHFIVDGHMHRQKVAWGSWRCLCWGFWTPLVKELQAASSTLRSKACMHPTHWRANVSIVKSHGCGEILVREINIKTSVQRTSH